MGLCHNGVEDAYGGGGGESLFVPCSFLAPGYRWFQVGWVGQRKRKCPEWWCWASETKRGGGSYYHPPALPLSLPFHLLLTPLSLLTQPVRDALDSLDQCTAGCTGSTG